MKILEKIKTYYIRKELREKKYRKKSKFLWLFFEKMEKMIQQKFWLGLCALDNAKVINAWCTGGKLQYIQGF